MKHAAAAQDLTTLDGPGQLRRTRERLDGAPQISRADRESGAPLILNVDDDDAWRQLKSRLLESAGYEVVEASSGESALGLARTHQPTLVLLDVHLPGLDGFEVCRRLKNDGDTCFVPVLHVSAACITDTHWANGLASEADSYLAAPFSDELLLSTIASLLQRAEREARVRRARTKAIRNLRRSERRYRNFVEHAPFGLMTVADDGRILEANRALTRLLGYHRLTGMPVEDLFVATGEWDQVRQRWARRASRLDYDLQWRTTDGHPLIVRLTGRPLQLARSVRGFEVFVEDVTERRRLEDERRQAQKMEAIGALAAGIAHDFNNLLTTILGYTELMLEQIGADKPIHGDLCEIQEAGRSAAALTKQLLAFGRKQAIVWQVLDVNAIVRRTEQWLGRVLGEETHIVIRTAADLPPIRGDRVQLEQVLINLAVNARDAMPGGGTLTIETQRVDPVGTADGWSDHPQIRIAVSDTGCGMDAATRERIFEPFFTTKELGRGTGLGLATVYGIVQQLGGAISVASETDRGTTFSLCFPTSNEPLPSEAPRLPHEGEPVGREHVLLVEDDHAVRTLTRDILARHGYHVIAAADPLEALRIATDPSTRIELILTDVVMPRMTGPELMREVLTTRQITAIYMSGYVSDDAKKLIDRQERFLSKPFSARELLTSVRNALDSAGNESSVPRAD